MRKLLLLVLISLGASGTVVGYCAVVVDWVQDISGDGYRQDFAENALKTVALAVYTYFGIRFFNRNIGSFR